MKSRIFYIALLITTSNLLADSASYGSDQAGTLLPKPEDTIKDALTKQAKQGDTKVEKRTQKRSQGRETQKLGKAINKNVKAATEPLHGVGMAASTLAYASGDPHARLAAMALNITIYAVEALGRGIAQIVMGVGRYQERSQEILSITEVLIEDYQKTTDKIKALKKKLKEFLDVDKPPEPSQSSSRLKQLGKSASNAVKTAEIKVHQATDLLTNEKAARGEKIKAVQADLKVETENSEEIIRILQIKLMQDAVKEIDKRIHITDTIAELDKDVEFYGKAKLNLSKSKSKEKKQIAEIEAKDAQANKELNYYLKFRKSLPESDEELQDPLPKSGEALGEREEFVKKLKESHVIKKLVEDRESLRKEITELTQLTKMGDAIYLQKKEVQLDSEVNRSAIVGLYKEIDAIKSQLEALGKTTSTKDATGAASKQPLEAAKNQRNPLQKASPTQTSPAEDPTLRDSIIKQRQDLRPVRRPSLETLPKKSEG